ncbi:MAG: hypothetical protein PVSMB7_20790 [Chloroflexota bacterium]
MAVVGAVLCPAGVWAGGPAPRTVHVAVSLRGSIVLFAADGSNRTVLTHSGQDFAPVMAPGGKAVAFWRGRFTPLHATRRQVMVARADGHGGWRVAPFSLQTAFAGGLGQTLAWAPDGNGLAWFSGTTVQYRHGDGPQRAVLQVGSGTPAYQSLDLAFSRDGGTIAAPLPTAGTDLPHTLRVAVRRLDTARQRTIIITFRPGVLLGPNARGSVPVGDGLGYTTSQLAPPGHTLQVETVAAPGIGRQMTGIFLAPDTGGRARLVQGNGHGLHGIPPFGYGLQGATHFEDAPNHRYLATDPTGGFYVAGQIGPLHISAPTPVGCVQSQWTWLADSVHLAYVTDCAVPGSSPIRFRLALTTVSIGGGAPVVLYRTTTSNPNALDLAPGYRCVACG